MRQQLLNLTLPPDYGHRHWVRHAGVEAAQNRLALWMVHGGRLWLTSEAPAGKTHLLHALAAEHPALALLDIRPSDDAPARQVRDWLDALGGRAFWLADAPAGPMPRPTALALFHLMERAREMRRHLAVAWRGNPDALPPDCASRLKALERVDMAPPATDADLTAVLRAVAHARQWHVEDGVIATMLTHLPRDLNELVAALAAFERGSLAERKRLTRAWAARRIRAMHEQRQRDIPAASG
jgi:chromosomal replication initiation ATPase DnaA